MNISYAEPSEIPHIIAQNLKEDSSSVFVFPTDVAASSWADWAVLHPDLSGAEAVPLERFTAWDKFKSSMMNAKVAGRTSIPSLLRKLFVRSLIAENAEKAAQGQPLFKSIISPEFASQAYSFTDWVSRILPSLEVWHGKYMKWLEKTGTADGDSENADYMTLYTMYTAYLDRNGLFEPSWITPDFSMQGAMCIVFYPETLEDFSDYREMMEHADHVQLVMLPESASRPSVSFYSDSRTELRATALRIRRLAESGRAAWSDIAVSTADMETWRPYIEREFTLYNIPYVIRAGEPYTAGSAGRIFREIQDCMENGFSYDSVRSLLLDGYVPWKEKALNQNLVRLGSEYKCICSYTEDGKTVDSWEKALSSSNTGNTAERERNEYMRLRQRITALCGASTFAEIRSQWFAFRKDFLDSSGFTEDADLILGRCLMVLSELIDIEEQFVTPAGMHVPSPYSFFLNELENSMYQKQPDHSGVSVFPYRLSSCACIPYQFVLDAAQKQLTVPYRSLSFLNKRKREELLGPDSDNASDAFVRLYAEKGSCTFSASQQTFGGFAIPYSFLVKQDAAACTAELAELAGHDFVTMEAEGLSGAALMPEALTQLQKDGFGMWARHIAGPEKAYGGPCAALRGKIDYLLFRNRSHHDGKPGVMHISQTDLGAYYPCRRAWVLGQVLRLRDDTLDTSLMEQYDAGTINHKILELFMQSYAQSGGRLPVTNADGVFDDEAAVRAHLVELAGKAFLSPEMSFCRSPLVLAVLDSQKENFADAVISFLHTFCSSGARGFGGYTVHAVEEWADAPFGGDGSVALTGRIDCILADDEGGMTVVDYKNSQAPLARDCIADKDGKLGDFQIPLYVTLLKGNVENALFYTIRGQKASFIVENNKEGRSQSVTAEEYKRTLESFDGYVNGFVSGVRSGDFGIDSDSVEAYRDCASCRFKTVCRTTFLASGVRIPEKKAVEK